MSRTSHKVFNSTTFVECVRQLTVERRAPVTQDHVGDTIASYVMIKNQLSCLTSRSSDGRNKFNIMRKCINHYKHMLVFVLGRIVCRIMPLREDQWTKMVNMESVEEPRGFEAMKRWSV